MVLIRLFTREMGEIIHKGIFTCNNKS